MTTENIYKKKDRVQNEALQAWRANKGVGSVIMATGTGKTRVGVLAAQRAWKAGKINSVTIVVPSTNLRDNEWVNEFTKWGAKALLEFTTITCVQSLYKEDHFTDLLIVDEVHTALSPEYRKVFENTDYKFLLCLTATPPHEDEYLELLNTIAPIVYSVTLQEAVKMGLISPFKVYNVPIKLTNSERFMYTKWTQMFTRGRTYLNGMTKPGVNAFDLSRKYKDTKFKFSHPETHEHAKAFWQGMSMRKWVCYKAENKLCAAVRLIKAYPDNKWIIFAKSIKYVTRLHRLLIDEGIGSVLYHSQLSAKAKQEVLNEATKDSIRVICSVEALSAGYDLPVIDSAICLAGSSTALPTTQQLGRICRFQPDKEAMFINLYAQATQEENWVQNKTQDLGKVFSKALPDLLNHGNS